MDREELIKLLDLEMKEEQYFLSFFHKEVAFFWSIISAIIAGITVGLFKASLPEHYLFLTSAPILLFGTTYFMKNALFRSYQRFLECIATRAKIEQLLGFHTQSQTKNSSYWVNEPILPQRYLTSRSKFNSSGEFVKYYSKRGIYEVYVKLITVIQVISVVSAITLTVYAIAKA